MAKRFDIHEWQAKQAKQRLTEQNIDSKNPDRDPWQDLYGKQNPNDPKAIPGKHFSNLESEISKYIGQTFASWMSPDNPPFAQEYAKPPYIDKLVKGIMDILPANMSEIEVTGMEPDTGNMEKEFNVIGPANQSDPLTDVTIEYNEQEYILDFEFGDTFEDHGNKGKDEWWEATADDGTIFRVDVYMVHEEGRPEPFWDTLEIIPSKDPRMDPAIRSDFDDPIMEGGMMCETCGEVHEGTCGIDEQNSLGTAGAGASFSAGNSMAYMPNNAFKKKKK